MLQLKQMMKLERLLDKYQWVNYRSTRWKQCLDYV